MLQASCAADALPAIVELDEPEPASVWWQRDGTSAVPPGRDAIILVYYDLERGCPEPPVIVGHSSYEVAHELGAYIRHPESGRLAFLPSITYLEFMFDLGWEPADCATGRPCVVDIDVSAEICPD
ncbi:MAG: hypothetical protein AAGH15_06585 [Myxococcota bacterium]